MENPFIIIGLGIVAAGGWILYQFTQSSAATRLGVSNLPDTVDETINVLYYATVVDPSILECLREYDPNTQRTSGYRSDAVNEAVGGSSTSRHKMGLADDYSTCNNLEAAKYLRSRAPYLGEAGAALRTVIVETTPPHVHIDVFGPSEDRRACSYLWERDGGDKFVQLP